MSNNKINEDNSKPNELFYFGYSEFSTEGTIGKIVSKYIPNMTKEDFDELIKSLKRISIKLIKTYKRI